MMTLNDTDIEELLTQEDPDGTKTKPTIGAKRKFEQKLKEWRAETSAVVLPHLEQEEKTVSKEGALFTRKVMKPIH